MTFNSYIENNINASKFKYFKPTNFEKLVGAFNSMFTDAKETKDTLVCCVGDWDVDGVLSMKILTNTLADMGLEKYDIYFGTSKEHGMTQAFVNECIEKDYKYVIVTDSSTNSMEIINYLDSIGVTVIILDHHVCNYNYSDYPERAVIINSKMEGNEVIREISAGLLVYLVTSFYRKTKGQDIKEEDMWFAYVTLISDSCKLSDKYIKPLILGIQNVESVPREINLFTNKYTVLNRRFFTYNFNSKINNMCRLERIDLIKELFYGNVDLKRKSEIVEEIEEIHKYCKEGLRSLSTMLDGCVQDLGSCTLVDLDKALSLTDLPEVYIANATGLLASRVSSNTGKASIAYISWDKESYKLSGRDNYGLYPFQEMLRTLNLEGGGHIEAVGFKIPKLDLDKLKEFAKNVDSVLEKEEDKHILKVSNLSENNLKKLFKKVATLNEISGNGLKPIKIRIKLDSSVLKMKDIGKLRLFEIGDIQIKDLMQSKSYGDVVDIEPEYNKFLEALVCYF